MASEVTKEASPTSGVQAFSIQGRLYRERQRLTSMTAKERAWRQQWIKDQHLAPDEPTFVPKLYKELYNPFRRAYRLPLDTICNALKPVLGKELAIASRTVIGQLIIGFAVLYCATYYFKYNTNDWTRKGGWRIITSRTKCVPGDADYPAPPDRNVGADYGSRGFKDSPI